MNTLPMATGSPQQPATPLDETDQEVEGNPALLHSITTQFETDLQDQNIITKYFILTEDEFNPFIIIFL